MYSIFVHLSGIAILEICFFFFYVGPMETTMFENTVKKLTNEPVNNMNFIMIQQPNYKLDLQKFSYITFDSGNTQINSHNKINIDDLSENNQDEILREMEELRDYGIERRNEKNHDLFMQTIEYWSILCAFTLLVCIVEYLCTKKKKVNGVTMVSSDDETTGLELGEGPYRKGSIDECSDDPLIQQSRQEEITCIDKCCNTCKQKCNKKCMKRTMYYISFGCCLLTFQYLFFQHVVYYYNPLSLEEVKYLLYVALSPHIPKIPEVPEIPEIIQV